MFKSTMGYNAVADGMDLSNFIHLVLVASKICEIPRNSPKIRTYSSSKSSKVSDLDGV